MKIKKGFINVIIGAIIVAIIIGLGGYFIFKKKNVTKGDQRDINKLFKTSKEYEVEPQVISQIGISKSGEINVLGPLLLNYQDNNKLTVSIWDKTCPPLDISFKQVGDERNYVCGAYIYHLKMIPSTKADLVTFNLSLELEDVLQSVDSEKVIDCGILSDKDPNKVLRSMSESPCFNEQFKICQPAILTAVLGNIPDYVIGNTRYDSSQTTNYIIIGRTANGCKVSTQHTLSSAIKNPKIYNCIYDNLMTWKDASQRTPKCIAE